MKQVIYLLTLLVVCTNCNGQTKEKNTAAVKADTSLKLQYDQGFVDGLSTLFEKSYTLNREYILVEKDTIYPPEELPLNKEIILHGADAHLLMTGKANYSKEQFFVSITRTNFTNITYKLVRVINDTILASEKHGIAILSTGPVLSSENETVHPNRLYFFPRFEEHSDSCDNEFMFEGLDENNKLHFNIRIVCANKKTGEPYSEQTLSLSEIFYTDEK